MLIAKKRSDIPLHFLLNLKNTGAVPLTNITHSPTSPCFRISAIAAAFALVSCGTIPKPTRMAVSASLSPVGSGSGRLYQEVNALRRNTGLKELQRHPGLDRLAQEHCEYLRKNRGTFSLYGNYVSHMGSSGRALIAQQRYEMNSVSENVAAISDCAGSSTQRIIKLWQNSEGHGKNLTYNWTHTGCGMVVDSDGMVFATQLFGTLNYSHMRLRERFNRF